MSEAAITALEAAHARMAASPEDDAARLGYHQVLADAVLFLWLQAEPRDDTLAPRVFLLQDGPVVLAFDTEERLAEAAGAAPVPYAALPGRVIAQALAGQEVAGQGVALGINLGVADSAYLVSPEALDWLTQTLRHGPVIADAVPQSFGPPGNLPSDVLRALQAGLARLAGLAAGAVLAGVVYADGRRGHMLAFLDADPGAQDALARAMAEALTFSGVEAGELDVVHLAADSAPAQALLRAGLRLDMTAAVVPPVAAPARPAGPPRLR
jgi:SseB protein N-terminal domain